MSAPYDLVAAFDSLAPGLVLQRADLDAVAAAYAANGFQPLTSAQMIAAVGPLPAPLTTIQQMDPV